MADYSRIPLQFSEKALPLSQKNINLQYCPGGVRVGFGVPGMNDIIMRINIVEKNCGCGVSCRKTYIVVGVILLTMAVIYGLFCYWVPVMLDDLNFIDYYRGVNEGRDCFSPGAFGRYIFYLRENENGRLANVLAPLATLMMPKWLYSIFTGAAVAAMFWLMARLARIRLKDMPLALMLLWVGSLLILPWRGSMMVSVYLLNYVYTSIAVLGFIYVMTMAVRGHCRSIRSIAGGMLLAAVAAWMHEGFSAPVSCGLVAYAISRRFRLPAGWWACAVVFGLMTIYASVAPGIMSRASQTCNVDSSMALFLRLVTILPCMTLMLLLFASSLFCRRLRGAWREIMVMPHIFILFISSVASGVIVLSLSIPPRGSWPAELFAMIVLLALGARALSHVSAGWATAVVITCYAGVCVVFTGVLYWQKKICDEYSFLMAECRRSSTGTVYHDIIDPLDIRTKSFFLTVRNIWVQSFQQNVINRHNDTTRYYSVVPAVLSRYDDAGARRVAGDSGLMDFKGVLVGPDGLYTYIDQGYYSDEVYYDFELADGSEVKHQLCFRTRFFIPGGGKRMYVWPAGRLRSPVVRARFVGPML